MNEKDFMTVVNLIKRGGVLEPLYNVSFSVATAGVCMILEELCKEHEADVVEVSKDLCVTVKEVNKELGKY